MTSFISKYRAKKLKLRSREESRKRNKSYLSLGSLLIAALVLLTAFLLLHFAESSQYALITPGQKAPATVIASVTFKCVDISQTELNRQKAMDSVPPVFTIDYDSYNTAARSLSKLLSKLIQLRRNNVTELPDEQHEKAITDILDLLNIPIGPTELNDLMPPGQEEKTIETIKSALHEVVAAGIISQFEKNSSFRGLASSSKISIFDPDGNKFTQVNTDNIHLPEQALEKITNIIALNDPASLTNQSIIADFLQPWVKPNLVYNPSLTERLRAEARRNVPDVIITVQSGTTLVEARERITQDIHEKLRAHERRLQELATPKDRLMSNIGDSALLLVAMVVCVGLLRIMAPDILLNKKAILIMWAISLFTLLPAKGLLLLTNDYYWHLPLLLVWLLPLGLAPLLGTVLLNGTAGVIVGFWCSFVCALLFRHNFAVVIIGMLVTTLAVYFSQGVHRRSSLLRAGLWIGLANIFCAAALVTHNQQSPMVFLAQAAAGLFNGLGCALIVLIILPLLEALFTVTTDITLVELSDMRNPILQRLALEAPGTYHHSIMVANLAASAAREIGANELLVRVCAYFHDIGKLTKPEFYIENTQFRENPHDELSPNMSTLVVLSHVKEGITLAQRHKLPPVIIKAIQQHHGTSLVRYFYHRAKLLQESKKEAPLNEQDFRYSGPRPVASEIAILLLADSVEAASRSLEKSTVSRIDNLVHDVVDEKLEDGQLDDCQLTLAQLATIKRSFTFTLTNMFHGRIAYPQNKDENSAQQSPETEKDPDTSPA